MDRFSTIALMMGGLMTALLGCGAPQAAIESRAFVKGPLPQGKIAMLPPVLSPQVQDTSAAAAFVDTLTRQLQAGGIDLAAENFGGRLRVRLLATQPTTAKFREGHWLSVGDAQRAQMAQGTPYAVICQPVVQRYGYCKEFVPSQTIEILRGQPSDASPDLAAAADGDAAVVNSPADRDARRGKAAVLHYANGMTDPLGETQDIDPGAMVFEGYAEKIPAHYEPAAQIVIEYYFYNAATGQRVYYILAKSENPDYQPVELQAGFAKPLTQAFLKAQGR